MGLDPIGKETKYGKIQGVASKEGKRYYFLIDKQGEVALLPAETIEEEMSRCKDCGHPWSEHTNLGDCLICFCIKGNPTL